MKGQTNSMPSEPSSTPNSLMSGAWNFFQNQLPTMGMSFGGVNNYLGNQQHQFGPRPLVDVDRQQVDQWIGEQAPAPQPAPVPAPSTPAWQQAYDRYKMNMDMGTTDTAGYFGSNYLGREGTQAWQDYNLVKGHNAGLAQNMFAPYARGNVQATDPYNSGPGASGWGTAGYGADLGFDADGFGDF